MPDELQERLLIVRGLDAQMMELDDLEDDLFDPDIEEKMYWLNSNLY